VLKRAPKEVKRQPLRLYTAYQFTDQDPVIEAAQAIALESGKSRRQMARESNVSTSTFRGWWDKVKRPVRCPRFATVAAFAASQGYTGYDWKNKRFLKR
jgi:hypothetical protein